MAWRDGSAGHYCTWSIDYEQSAELRYEQLVDIVRSTLSSWEVTHKESRNSDAVVKEAIFWDPSDDDRSLAVRLEMKEESVRVTLTALQLPDD
jgi:hypothetical protein